MKKIFDAPYYAVIFKSKRSSGDNGYDEMARQMLMKAELQEGFLGIDSVRGSDGIGITVSYWASLENIEKWKHDTLHMQAKAGGRAKWYEDYTIRICKVEYDNEFSKK
ncbi:antibiotic biosynthesis monooxygenase [Oscillospiraceae bacterium MB08-C2-2]|nr:antibiotic biosynthesis monooxygenase [Oscillospiraceae bacterium MB08-C2-2]